MTRWIAAACLACATAVAVACPLCMGYKPSTAQQLAHLGRAVVAEPAADGQAFRVVEVVKGKPPAGGMVTAAAVQAERGVAVTAKSQLLVSDEGWPSWFAVGAIGRQHADWLRRIATGKRAQEMSAAEWHERVAFVLPLLENPEPLVAEIAYGEIAQAPYAELIAAKARLSAPVIRKWLADPKLASRQPLYLLLLGVAGNAQDAAAIERELEAAWDAADVANVGSLIAADLQLRGAARVSWVDEHYLTDRKRSSRELEAALLALSVHGNAANGPIPRERVIASYRRFMQARPDMAGYVAQDFAAWQYWDAVPEYVTLLKSGIRQQYPSRIAIIAYLRQSPAGKAGNLDLPLTEGVASQQASGVLGKPALPVIPQ